MFAIAKFNFARSYPKQIVMITGKIITLELVI